MRRFIIGNVLNSHADHFIDNITKKDTFALNLEGPKMAAILEKVIMWRQKKRARPTEDGCADYPAKKQIKSALWMRSVSASDNLHPTR